MKILYIKIGAVFLFIVLSQGCSGIAYITGKSIDTLNEFVTYGFKKPSIEEIESECTQQIFRTTIVSFSENFKSISIHELNTSKKIETRSIQRYENAFVIRRLRGDTNYLITTDTNQRYVLSDIVGKFNARCNMFSCEPVCSIESYKINGQISEDIFLMDGYKDYW